MDSQSFVREQFITLRREIAETKARIFKIISLGVIVVPAANFLAQVYQLDALILSLPILVIVLALLYLSENHALMRCGRFIRLHIEPQFPELVGWERWLESPAEFQPRTVDKFVSYGFYLLFFIYYGASTFLSVRFGFSNYGVIPASIILGGYFAIGIWFLIFLIQNIRVATSTKLDKVDPTILLNNNLQASPSSKVRAGIAEQ